MSSIGLLFIADSSPGDLPVDFTPPPLGTFEHVAAVIERCAGIAVTENRVDLAPRFLSLEVEDLPEPRVVTAAGVWGDEEMKVIRCLCRSLGAQFYDSENADFIE